MTKRKKATTKKNIVFPNSDGFLPFIAYVSLMDDNNKMIGLAHDVTMNEDGTCRADKVFVLNVARGQKEGIWDFKVDGLYWYRNSLGNYRVSKFKHQNEYVPVYESAISTTEMPLDFLVFEE